MTTRRYLFCYDIADPRRLRLVAKTLESFGRRVQYSVFECLLDATQLARAKKEVGEVIENAEDQVLIVSLVGAEQHDTDLVITSLGQPYTRRSTVAIV